MFNFFVESATSVSSRAETFPHKNRKGNVKLKQRGIIKNRLVQNFYIFINFALTAIYVFRLPPYLLHKILPPIHLKCTQAANQPSNTHTHNNTQQPLAQATNSSNSEPQRKHTQTRRTSRPHSPRTQRTTMAYRYEVRMCSNYKYKYQ